MHSNDYQDWARPCQPSLKPGDLGILNLNPRVYV